MNEGDWIIEMPRGIPKMIQCMIELVKEES